MTVDASGSYCDSFCVFDRLERFYWWQRRHCDDWVSFFTETDVFLFFSQLPIIIIIIIINKLYATVSEVADGNIDTVGNLHK